MMKPSWWAATASLLLHAALAWAWLGMPFNPPEHTATDMVWLEPPPPTTLKARPLKSEAMAQEQAPLPRRSDAHTDAPLPPSDEEWALAASYGLKNAKRYRHTWGQQVRSMMGTAYDDADQGQVMFEIEIAPSGQLVSLKTVWSTSKKAEALARAAIARMPPLPPTPNGQPLIFEKMISFQAVESGWPPMYKDDCQPDPPKHRNAFAWNGQGEPTRAASETPPQPMDPEALAACMAQLPQDSMEAQIANDERQLKQWSSRKLDTP